MLIKHGLERSDGNKKSSSCELPISLKSLLNPCPVWTVNVVFSISNFFVIATTWQFANLLENGTTTRSVNCPNANGTTSIVNNNVFLCLVFVCPMVFLVFHLFNGRNIANNGLADFLNEPFLVFHSTYSPFEYISLLPSNGVNTKHKIHGRADNQASVARQAIRLASQRTVLWRKKGVASHSLFLVSHWLGLVSLWLNAIEYEANLV